MNGKQTSIPHLVIGLVFLGIAAAWALHAAGVIEPVQAQWVLPLILVVAGAAGLLTTMARGLGQGRGRGRDEETLVTEEGPGETG